MRITDDGQITIPAHIRAILGIAPQTDIQFVEEEGRFYIVRNNDLGSKDDLSRFRGIATTGMSTDEILSLTREA